MPTNRFAAILLRRERLKGAEGHFLAFCASGRKTYPLLLDEWAFRRGEWGEMLDEYKERPNETSSFVFLNLEDSFRFII